MRPLTNEPLAGTGTSSFGTGTHDTATSSTIATAADQAKNVAGTAKEEAGNVAGTAVEQARKVVGDAKQQVSAQVSDQATTQRDKLSQTLHTFGNDLQQMAEQGPSQGMATDLAHEVSERVRAFGDHLEGRDPSQLLDDARDFARRRPGTFLIGALAAGVVAGRLFRATADGAAAAELDQAKVPTPRTRSTSTDTFAGVGTSDTTAVPRRAGLVRRSGHGTAADLSTAGRGDVPHGSAAEDARAAVRVSYLTAITSTVLMSGSLASRSGPT